MPVKFSMFLKNVPDMNMHQEYHVLFVRNTPGAYFYNLSTNQSKLKTWNALTPF